MAEVGGLSAVKRIILMGSLLILGLEQEAIAEDIYYPDGKRMLWKDAFYHNSVFYLPRGEQFFFESQNHTYLEMPELKVLMSQMRTMRNSPVPGYRWFEAKCGGASISGRLNEGSPSERKFVGYANEPAASLWGEDSSLYYPNGKLLFGPTGQGFYPNGSLARKGDELFALDGSSTDHVRLEIALASECRLWLDFQKERGTVSFQLHSAFEDSLVQDGYVIRAKVSQVYRKNVWPREIIRDMTLGLELSIQNTANGFSFTRTFERSFYQ